MRGAVRDPVVLVVGVGGLAASTAVLVGAGERLLRYDSVSLDPLEVTFPLSAHLGGSAPAAIALAAAAVGTLRGWSGWATAAVALSLVVGATAMLADPEADRVSVLLAAVLLVGTGITRDRLVLLAEEQERPAPHRAAGPGPASGSATATSPPPA